MKEKFLKKALALKPHLHSKRVMAKGQYGSVKAGEARVFDLGDHCVGKVRIDFSVAAGAVDAPTLVKLDFAERKEELQTMRTGRVQTKNAWIQEELVHIDYAPCRLDLPRRYACRYIRVEILSCSAAYTLSIDGVFFKESTSATGRVRLTGANALQKRIDKTALRTLRNCMQEVFEDGPKRDRRLWLGDLRLQALTNYQTYKNYALVKRCLYLFAGTADEDGRVHACVFTEPEVYVSETKIFDYALLLTPTLLEYLEATGDRETAEELYPIAMRQIELAREVFSDGLIVRDGRIGWCFIDWCEAVDKEACGQAVYIYALKSAQELSAALGKECAWLEEEILDKSQAAIREFFDEARGAFVGKNGEISYVENAWFALAGVLPKERNREILISVRENVGSIKPVTPYAYHYFVQALFDCGETERAFSLIAEYWGGMIELGADTFYELFDPNAPQETPYEDPAINSYCHAWSCTPAFFFRKYGEKTVYFSKEK